MKKHLLSYLLVCALLVLLLPLEACKGTQNFSLSYYEYFDTYCTITFYDVTEADYQVAKTFTNTTLKTWHQYTDIYNEYPSVSNVCSINRAEGCQTLVSTELGRFLEYAVEAYSVSLGTVNVCMGTVTKLWHDAMETHVLPSPADLKEASTHTAIENLSIDFYENGALVSLTDFECQLDVGALAKGYVAEILYQGYLNLGIANFLINLGGAITTHGKPIGNNRDFFRIGILNASKAKENPDTQEYLNQYADLTGCGSVITSGNYMRYFELEGVRYNHIIDSATLFPAMRYDSVTIILDPQHNDPKLGDLLSTALFILDRETGIALAKEYNATVIYQINGDVTTY